MCVSGGQTEEECGRAFRPPGNTGCVLIDCWRFNHGS